MSCFLLLFCLTKKVTPACSRQEKVKPGPYTHKARRILGFPATHRAVCGTILV